MPICPQCSATIHAGADDQCPACGYSLRRADAVFGDGQVEFTRVVDAAGALTHQERQELLHFLENLERDAPPIALCIYITDDGQADEFRTHAHWILNHARIHHPSFGRREKHKAIEDAELRVRQPGEAPVLQVPPPAPVGWLTRLGNYLRDALHPHLPPPVKQEWMLILVLDVQLERACFSWGYQLDPYINPDSINRCIVGAKLQFRERAMVSGLRRVMRAALTEITSGSRRVNARLRRSGLLRSAAAFLGLSLALASAPCYAAAEKAPEAPAAVAPPALPDDDVAEEVLPSVPSPEVQPAPSPAGGDAAAVSAEPAPPPSAPAPEPGAPATYSAPPRWHEEDYRHLMAGELPEAYGLLLPQLPDSRPASPRFRSLSSAHESDSKVLGRYSDGYKRVSRAGLADPQGLLTVEERRDVEHVLRELNANGRFRIYVALLRSGQQLPPELSVQMFTNAISQPCEYSVLLLFPLGDSLALDLGYQEVNPSDEQRYAWLQQVRSAAAPEGHGVESLLLAVREVHSILSPLSAAFRPVSPETAGTAPHIPVEYRPDSGEKEVPAKEKIAAFFQNEAIRPALYALLTLVFLLLAAVILFLLRRRSGQLLESVADVRLSSPYGAGVSRYVRYLEGKESPKESRIF